MVGAGRLMLAFWLAVALGFRTSREIQTIRWANTTTSDEPDDWWGLQTFCLIDITRCRAQ